MSSEPTVNVIPWGCTLTHLAPRNASNTVLSFARPESYLTTGNPAYFGETIGRVANRISGARISALNGRVYALPDNGDDGKTCLHGGERGWGKRAWQGPETEERADGEGVRRDGVQKFTYLSGDGEEGFPGNVMARAWWSCHEEGEKTVVEVEYEAEMLEEQPPGVEETVVSMTNHSYFNLTPTCNTQAPSIAGTIVTLPTTRHLALSPEDNTPTGTIVSLEQNSPIQPHTPFQLGDNTPCLDHCFVLNEHPRTILLDSRGTPLRMCIAMTHPGTGVHLEVWSSEPAFQVYTGDANDVVCEQVHFGARSGVAVEPGRYTDAVSQEGWRGMVVLRRGETWGSRIRYVTWKERVQGNGAGFEEG